MLTDSCLLLSDSSTDSSYSSLFSLTDTLDEDDLGNNVDSEDYFTDADASCFSNSVDDLEPSNDDIQYSSDLD